MAKRHYLTHLGRDKIAGILHIFSNVIKGPISFEYLLFMMTSSSGQFFALLAICAGNSPVTGEFPTQRPVTRSFDVFVDLRLNKRTSKQSWGWRVEKPSRPLWRHCDVLVQAKMNGLLSNIDLCGMMRYCAKHPLVFFFSFSKYPRAPSY